MSFTSPDFIFVFLPAVREGRGRKGLLFLGMAVKMGALGYFKYAGFFVENLNAKKQRQRSERLRTSSRTRHRSQKTIRVGK